MGLAEITLHIVHNVASLALALVLANADSVQAGQVTVGHTLCALAIPVVARSAFAGIGRYAMSAILAGTASGRVERDRDSETCNNHIQTILTAHK